MENNLKGEAQMGNENMAFENKRQVYHYEPAIPPEEAIPKQYFAGFWIRFLAYIIDLIAITAISGIIVNPIFRVMDLSMDTSFFTTYWILTTVVFLIYFILMTKFFGQTLGKMLFGLRVVNLDRTKLTWLTVLFREGAMRFVLKTIWPLYVVCAFTPNKQGFADLLESTSVVHVGYLELDEKWTNGAKK